MKISLCIPMYNEAAIIGATARTLSAYMSERFSDYEILFSDDGSTDDSRAIVDSLQLPNVRVIGEKENRGKGYAVRRAMLASCGELVLFTDADLAYGTEVIGQAADLFSASPYDVLIGSRRLDKEGYGEYTLLRKVTSRAYHSLLRIGSGIRVSDAQCGFKAFRGAAARTIFSLCETDRFAFDLEVILLAQKKEMTITEMPVRIRYHGASKVSVFRDSFRMLRDLRKIKKRIKNV